MGCIVEFTESRKQIEFCSHGDKQKILIDALLNYSSLNLTDLALILNIPEHIVKNIHDGISLFEEEQANNLTVVFLTYFCELDCS